MVLDSGTDAPGPPPLFQHGPRTCLFRASRVQPPCPATRHPSPQVPQPPSSLLPPTPPSHRIPQDSEWEKRSHQQPHPHPPCPRQDNKTPQSTPSALPARPGASELLLPSGTDIFTRTQPQPRAGARPPRNRKHNGRYPPFPTHGSRDTRREILRQPRHRWSGGGPGFRCRPCWLVISLRASIFASIRCRVSGPCLFLSLPSRLGLDTVSRRCCSASVLVGIASVTVAAPAAVDIQWDQVGWVDPVCG